MPAPTRRREPARDETTTRLLILACTAVLLAGCGKKGPPLAPVVHIPGAADVVAARRVGDDVFVTVTVPMQNVDQTAPADVGRVEIYGFTSLLPPPAARFLEAGPPLATLRVGPPDRSAAGGAATVRADLPLQGDRVTVRDTLTADKLMPLEVAPPPKPPAKPPTPGALRRFYLAIAFSERGRPGPPGKILEMPLTALPDPPVGLQVTYTASTLSLAWGPSGGILGFLLDRAGPVDRPPIDGLAAIAPGVQGDTPAGPSRYNVYRTMSPDPIGSPVTRTVSRVWDTPPPAPVNSAPLAALAFDEPVTFGRERCYTVRTVRGRGAGEIEGAGAETCLTPVDTFPPATPTGLRALAGDGAIELVWEPNDEPDLGGYLVLRGVPGDATLTRLTPTPIAEGRFTDRSVTPGERYVYAVLAVDTRVPLPNESGESGRVDITVK